MSLRYPGGLITKSPTAPTTSAAKGVWTLEQALQYIKAGTWPLSVLGDPYFQYNTMLLPGQGTNGAQNNTFLDSSTNNFTITRNGNTTQGTFTPFSGANGNWSNFFDGSGDYLSVPDNAAWNMGSGDFTAECWIYPTSFANEAMIMGQWSGDTGGTTLNWALLLSSGSTGYLRLITSSNGSSVLFDLSTSTFALSLNVWQHIAAVRNGNTFTIYVDGVSRATTTNSSSLYDATNVFTIGAESATPNQYFTGFISNARVVKGTAVYTSAFTPPTSPLTAISGTSLLTCQSNRFVDNSTNAFALTANGNVAVTPFQPFGAPTVAYSASTIGGSGYFDGSGDCLTLPSSSNLGFGTSNFCVEFWFNAGGVTQPATPRIIGNNLTFGTNAWTIGISSNNLFVQIYNFTTTNPTISTSTNVINPQWNHIVLCRSGSDFGLFVNGTRVGTYSTSATLDGGGSQSFCVGGRVTSEIIGGYISDCRVVIGSSVYTPTSTTLTVPTAPLTAITNTQLLCNFTNAGIIDNAQDNDLETVGNAQISTTQYKWGASSMYFDGTGDYLTAPAQQNIAFGTGDFTIECWIYFNSVGNAQIASGSSGATTNAFYWQYFSSQLQFGAQGSAAITAASWTPSANTWYHVAVVRTASTIKQYVNGNLLSSASSSQSFVDAVLFVGFGGAGTLNGYIQDLRITKGYARYPYPFTAPTAAFPLFWQAAATPSADPYFDYTTLLLPGNGTNGAQNNTFLDSSTNNFSITRNGNTTQGTFTPFSQTGWGNFFDGTGDYLTVASSADFNIFGGDMTVECWFYSTADSLGTRSEHLFAFVQDATNRESLYFNGTTLTFWTSSGAGNGPRITYANTPQNQWIHVAVAKSGSTFTMYINGVSVGTSTTTQYSTSNQSLQIGTYNSAGAGPDSFTGYISNARVVKGTAVYTANFIPSTTPLTSVTNTVLLTCQSNRFVDTNTQTTAKTVTPSGDTSVQAFSPFNPTAAYSASTVGGSGYFDGTGDFLSVANNAAFNFGSGAFTIEFWYYPTTLSGTQCLVTNYGGSTTGFVIQMGGSTPGSGRIDAGFSGDGADITSTNAVRLNSWNHIAISGTPGATGIKLFINGAQEGSTYTGATSLDTSSTLLIGEVASTNRLFGYLCGLRLVKGGALYTANFTPPTSPPTTTVSSGTVSLLTNFTNGAIIDNTAKHDLETVGGAAISTTQSKFGGSSMYFDGVDDNAIIPYNPIFSIGTADFTVEGWFYFSNLSTTARALVALGDGANGGGPYNAWTLRYLGSEGSNQLEFYRYDGTGFNYTTSGLTLSASTWYHIAVARYSGVLKIFVNGISYYSNTVTTNFGAINTNPMRIALQYYGPSPGYGGPRYWNGYINDLRITKGIARYTQNFTPPATAFLTL